jgi:hypothetical protein
LFGAVHGFGVQGPIGGPQTEYTEAAFEPFASGTQVCPCFGHA